MDEIFFHFKFFSLKYTQTVLSSWYDLYHAKIQCQSHRQVENSRSHSGSYNLPTHILLFYFNHIPYSWDGNLKIWHMFQVKWLFHPRDRALSNLTLRIQFQILHVVIQLRSHSQPSIQLIYLLFISHQSNYAFLLYSYFKFWPWKSKVNVIGQKLRLHRSPSIQLIYLFLISHQSNHNPEILLCQNLTLKIQGKSHGCGQRSRSHSWPSI